MIRDAGYKQKEVAHEFNISENGLVNYLKGSREPPVTLLYDITHMCKSSVEWVITGELPPVEIESGEVEPVPQRLLEKILAITEENARLNQELKEVYRSMAMEKKGGTDCPPVRRRSLGVEERR